MPHLDRIQEVTEDFYFQLAALLQLHFFSIQVDTISNFEWQRQLRYYWDLDQDTCLATMALATYVYGYEYLGACPRLVITPLTVSHVNIESH